MLDDLSNKYATKREQALEQIESAAIASDDELARLFVELTALDTSNELAASYQALALSILIRIDAAGPHCRLVCDLIEEYGRHTGHADLLREAVDGRVGEDPPPGWHT